MTAPDPRAVIPAWTVVRGDQFREPVTFKKTAVDGTISAIDLTTYGSAWTAQLRRAEDDTTFVAFTIDATSASTGVLTFTLTPAQTAALNNVTYSFDLQATGGTVSPQTPFRGTLVVAKDFTQ